MAAGNVFGQHEEFPLNTTFQGAKSLDFVSGGNGSKVHVSHIDVVISARLLHVSVTFHFCNALLYVSVSLLKDA